MNYLKEIKTAKQVYKNEQELQEKKQAACRIIEFLAREMYDAELDLTQYQVWYAIGCLIDAIKNKY